MGLVDKIKKEAQKSGSSKGKFIFFPEGKKVRLRFLTDMDDGVEVVFHDSYELGINVPCQETFGRNCNYCDEEGLRTRSLYAWSVYDYESKEVKVLMFAVNNCSPVPAIMAMYENYGTLLDRDFVLTVTGKQQNKTFSVIPQDKNKFRNSKVKALSERQILSIIDKAYPDEDMEDDDEDEAPKKRPGKGGSKSKSKGKAKDDYDDDDFDDDFEDEEDEVDYSEMSAKELYKLCKERDIEVAPKKSENYYIKKLEAYDEAHDDWESEEDEDEWEDED